MAANGGRSLEETPTWAVAVVCFVLVAISIIMEHIIHLIGKWLAKRNNKALCEALEKLKSELMLLGFISLLLTAFTGSISRICVSETIENSWHPCDKHDENENYEEDQQNGYNNGQKRRLLVTFHDVDGARRRLLAAAKGSDQCEEGKVPLISYDGIHQLHIFIFVLAAFHVLCCLITLALGRAKMRRWKSWEMETRTLEYQYNYDPQRFRFARETSFGRRHMSFWSQSPTLLRLVCFFRQFVGSVAKVDYMTLRHGFIIAHLAPTSQSNFDFQQYINRTLDEDFKVIVSISPPIWFFTVLFLLFNTHGWRSYLWLPFIPLTIILLVGTKLLVIITKMGLRIEEKEIVRGIPIVQPGDDLFWFSRPRLLLYLIHFVFFQNAFQLAFFAWAWCQYGTQSCYQKKTVDVAIRISMGVLIQVICSYVTLPLYALVTQMGSNMKPTIFDEKVAHAIRNWHQNAKKQIKKTQQSGSVTPLWSRPSTPLHGSSPAHLLRYYKSELDSRNSSPGSTGTPLHGSSPPIDMQRYYKSELESRNSSPSSTGNSHHGSSSPAHLLRYYKSELDSRNSSPGVSGHKNESWLAETGKGTRSGNDKSQERIDEEIIIRDDTNHLNSQSSHSHHGTEIEDFSFEINMGRV